MSKRWVRVMGSVVVAGMLWTAAPAGGAQAARSVAAHKHRFRITKLVTPNNLYANGPDRPLKISWKGPATFPVKAVSAPRTCPAGYICSTIHHKFTTRAHQLVWKNAEHCQGSVPKGYKGHYLTWLVDAKGHRTQKVKTNVACHQGPNG